MLQFLGQFSDQEEHLEVPLQEPWAHWRDPFVKHGLGAPASSGASLLSLPHGVNSLYPSGPLPSWPLTHLSLEHSPERTRARERVCIYKSVTFL